MGIAEALEARRLIAARLLLDETQGPSDLSRLLGGSHSAVTQWKRTLSRKERDGLKGQAHAAA